MITNNTTDIEEICDEDLQNCENKAPISGGIIALIVVISIFVLITCIILVICWVKKREKKSNLSVFKKKRLENKISPEVEPKKALEDEENFPNNGSAENVVKLETICPQSDSEFTQWVILNQMARKKAREEFYETTFSPSSSNQQPIDGFENENE